MRRVAVTVLTGAMLASSVGSAALAQDKDVIMLKSGTGVVSGHPFFEQVERYNAEHPEVEVRLDIAPWSDAAAGSIAAALAAGSPPDIVRLSIPGVAGNGALQSPLLLDTSQFMTDEEKADYGPGIISSIDIGGKYVLWPQDLDWGTQIVANGDMLEAAGIDVAGIKANGWTFDEFREVAKKLTTADTYGFATSMPYAESLLLDLDWRGGVPDGSANIGPYFWGNKYDLDGPGAVATAQLIHDMQYTDLSMPQEVTGLTEHMPLLWSKQAAMVNYWHGAVGEIKAYNASIEKGEISGTPADFNVVLLPYPYNPATGGSTVNLNRVTGFALFKQDPYKGDEHTQHVLDFVRYVTEPENLAAFTNWEGTIPARASAAPFSTMLDEPEIAWWADFARAHAVYTYPFGHPAYAQISSDAVQPNLAALLNNEKTPEQFVTDTADAAAPILEAWVAANPDEAANWTTPPAGWPEVYMTPVSQMGTPEASAAP